MVRVRCAPVPRMTTCVATTSRLAGTVAWGEGRDAGYGELADSAERHALWAVGDVVGNAEDGAAGTRSAGPEIDVDGTARARRDGRARTGITLQEVLRVGAGDGDTRAAEEQRDGTVVGQGHG